MTLPCSVIEDLLPLYYDGVCSQESLALVEEHLRQCEQCKSALNAMHLDISLEPQSADGKKALKEINSKWKKSKRRAAFAGILLTLAIGIFLFAQISVHWYRNTALFYIDLGERMGVSPDYPHEYGPTTPDQAEDIPPKYLFPKEYFLGTADYEFWLRTPSFLDSHGALIVESTQARGEILDKDGNILSRSPFIRLAVHFREDRTPEYYVTLMIPTKNCDQTLILDGNCQLIRREVDQNSQELSELDSIMDQYGEEIREIIQAAQDVWNLE